MESLAHLVDPDAIAAAKALLTPRQYRKPSSR
jgi:hypothetical protein